MKWEDCESKKL